MQLAAWEALGWGIAMNGGRYLSNLWLPAAARLSCGGAVTSQLADLAARTGWDRHAERTVSVARGIYLGLPQSARLWLRRKEFVAADQEVLRRALVPAT